MRSTDRRYCSIPVRTDAQGLEPRTSAVARTALGDGTPSTVTASIKPIRLPGFVSGAYQDPLVSALSSYLGTGTGFGDAP